MKVYSVKRAMEASWLARKRLKIIKGYRGTPEEFKRVVEYWKPYGIKPRKYWYTMFCDGRDGYDPRYIPDSMWNGTILPYYNNLNWGRAYADKCAYDHLFPYLNRPRTIVKNSCGRFYNGNFEVIDFEEAVKLCLREKRMIVKSATFSSGGRNIMVLGEEDVNEANIRQILKDYRMNFIIQDLVEQHEALARLNPTSLNTLRIISFYFKNEVHILSAQLRIGGSGAKVDNYSSGGFACNVCEDGRLSERAVSKAHGWATEHPNGFRFADIVVPQYQRLIKVICEEHARLPHLNIIGWDFAIGKNGEPVFIELNVFPGQNQNGSGPSFGDLTEEVLRDVFIEKTLKGAFE